MAVALCLAMFCLPAACSSGSGDPVLQLYVAAAASHDHAASFNYREMRSGVRVFPLSENLGHNHTVTITEFDVSNIDFAFPVTVNSSTETGHSHPVTIQKLKFDN